MHDDADDHPLVRELASIRQTAARFQHEAHAAASMLQRYSVDSSRLHAHAAALEQENARLAHELDVLRAHPDVPHHPAVEQVRELSLALRRVSEKITLTEDTLLERTSELTDVRSDLNRARHAADGAYALAARMRAREETCNARQRELEFKARASEEERKMVDLVVQEYADLVRSLEGRKSAVQSGSISSITLVDNLKDGKSTLHAMLTAFSTESEQLHATIADLNAKISDLQLSLDAERTSASHDRLLLSQTRAALDKLNLEDQTAAKMVARYMKFSQASTNALQEQITTLKTRHTSMIDTLEFQLSVAESQLMSERAHTARLQDALDQLCEDLARESYGRRREVSLRLALLAREERVAEFMRRWARRARESYTRCYDSAAPPVPSEDAVQGAFYRVVSDAESLLSTLDDDIQISDTIRTSGSLARIMQSRVAVEALRSELQDEQQKRIEAVLNSAPSLPDGNLDGTASGIDERSQPQGTPLQNGNGAPALLLTPNGDARLKHEITPVKLSQSRDATSPMSIIGIPEGPIDDHFLVPTPVPPSVTEPTNQTSVLGEPPPVQDSSSILTTLLVDEESKDLQSHSPAVSSLDLLQDLDPRIEELPTTGETPTRHDISPASEANLTEDDTPLSPSIPSPTAAANSVSSLLVELGATKHRYDTLQYAFRDCSLALKELKCTLASPSPSRHTQTKLREHLEIALARIDDYAEDARVELEIRITDEELTVRGFETVLSVPGALADVGERAEVEASAREFVDGTDDGVVRALDKFGRKLEEVQHDVAVVKRAVHELAMTGQGNGAIDGFADDDGKEDDARGSGPGSGLMAGLSGLLGANTTTARARSPTPVQTFGAVMTSPRPRRSPELYASADEGAGPLAGLNLRIPMPTPTPMPPPSSYGHLGVGRAAEAVGAGSRPRTLSTMYTLGGLRSSSVGLGVGLGGSSPSPARTRLVQGAGIGISGRSEGLKVGRLGVSSPLLAQETTGGSDSAGMGRMNSDEHDSDFGGVE